MQVATDIDITNTPGFHDFGTMAPATPSGAIQIVTTNFDRNTAAFRLQGSLDGTNYADVEPSAADCTVTADAGDDVLTIRVTHKHYTNYRLVVDAVTVTAGTYTIQSSL